MLSPLAVHAQGAQPAKGAPAAKGRDITGAVVDVDGNPVASATVAIAGGGPTTTTAADGSFQLTGVATTSVTVEISAAGFTAKQVPVLGAATPLQLQIVIVKPAPAAPAPAETRMVGGVVSDAGHAPIAGATVTVHGTSLQAVTGADGSFALQGVPLGEVTLDIAAANQPPTSVTVPADRPVVAITAGVSSQPAAPTTRTIKGKVIDPATKEPIAGATVQDPSTGTTVFSEGDGTFTLENVPPGPVKLEVTMSGRETRLIQVAADQATVDVPLGLSEGEQIVIEDRAPVLMAKENVRNGASVIEGKDLTRVSAPTLDDALTGKLAGANLQFNSGAPGGGAQLRLRGISTINGQSSPLYVIDGVIISNVAIPSGANAITAAAAGGNSSNQDNPVNRIADLNPNDIESVEVLKGASAAALYGSKASNGVVIIRTKRGGKRENQATVTQRIGFSQVTRTLGSRTFNSLAEVEATFMEKFPALVQAYMNSGGKVFNHESEITRTPFLRETLGTVSGGSDNGSYYGSALIGDTPGVVIGTFYQKQTGKIGVGYKFGDRVQLTVSANVIHSTSDRGLTNNDNNNVSNYIVLAGTPSFLDLRPTNGVYPTNVAVGSGANPLQTVALLQNREDVWRIISGSSAAVDVYSGGPHKIQLTGTFGVDSFEQKNNLLSPNQLTFEPTIDGLAGTSIDATSTNLNWNASASALWTYIPDDHTFRSALRGGVTYESVDLNSVYVVGQGLTAGQPNVDSAAATQTTQTRLRTKDSGLYLQEELALLDDRLSVLGGLLGERSSLNGDTDKYYLFPKLAAAYAVKAPSKPSGSSLLDSLHSLSVRAAYGESGNRPNYGYRFTPLSSKTNVDGNTGIILGGTAGDPKIEPERQREFELGVDVATKDQRVAVELTAYQRSISNLLLQRALPTSVGFGTQFENGGGLRNRGLEASVQVRPVDTKVDTQPLSWTSRGVLTLNRSMITALPDGPFNITAAGFGAGLGAYRIEEGKSATQIVASIGGSNTLTVVGNGEPDFRVGWSNLVTFGDFTLSALIDWQHGSSIVNLTRFLYDGAGAASVPAGGNSPDVQAAIKRVEAFNGGDVRPYIEDASFVKVREISITYALPKKLVSQIASLRSLELSVSGRNLLTFTGYSGLDPEVSNFGNQPIGRNYDVAPYPPSRSFWFSVTAGI